MIPDDFKGTAAPRTDAGIATAATAIGCDPLMVKAIIAVETGGNGFLTDSRPKILCERHHFAAATGHRYDAAYPDISNPTPGGYAGGAAEYDRLSQMMALDRTAALESTSWGLPQIMGSNFSAAGFADIDTMIAAFCASEDLQLAAMVAFIVAAGCAEDLRRSDFADFARRYNGPNYTVNGYDKKIAFNLAQLRTLASAGAAPISPVRALNSSIQCALNLHGFGPLETDGWIGPKTSAALSAFQTANGLPATGQPDPDTDAALLAT
jgi:hypothetical protein